MVARRPIVTGPRSAGDRPEPGQSNVIVRANVETRSSTASHMSTFPPRPLIRSSGRPSPRSRTNNSSSRERSILSRAAPAVIAISSPSVSSAAFLVTAVVSILRRMRYAGSRPRISPPASRGQAVEAISSSVARGLDDAPHISRHPPPAGPGAARSSDARRRRRGPSCARASGCCGRRAQGVPAGGNAQVLDVGSDY